MENDEKILEIEKREYPDELTLQDPASRAAMAGRHWEDGNGRLSTVSASKYTRRRQHIQKVNAHWSILLWNTTHNASSNRVAAAEINKFKSVVYLANLKADIHEKNEKEPCEDSRKRWKYT